MIRIDEEVEPVIRIPIELRAYVELEEGKLEIVKLRLIMMMKLLLE